MASENKLSIGQRIHQRRERLNWSQERLAESVGATKMSVRRWEHDIVLPQPYYREQLCRVFNATSEMLFGVQEVESDAPVPIINGDIWHILNLHNLLFPDLEKILQQMHTILSHEKTVALTHPYTLEGLGGAETAQTAQPGNLAIYLYLAGLYREQGKYAEAEELLRRAIILCEKRLEGE